MKIYVVFGETGEYSDYIKWTVRCFDNRARAHEFVVCANAESKKIFELGDWAPRSSSVHSMDPDFEMHYNGTNYYYEVLDLEITGGLNE